MKPIREGLNGFYNLFSLTYKGLGISNFVDALH
jgi:hypothetical protein